MDEGRVVMGPEIFGSTVVTDGDAFFARRTTPFELLLGGHYTAARQYRVGFGIGPGLTRAFGTPLVRVLASFEWVQPVEPPPEPPAPPSDRDKDAIVDTEDACPDEPGVKTEDPKTNGCPPPKDRDGDEILDVDDACPDEPGVKTEDPKTNGCPPPKDRDGDEILDVDDACPEVPGPRNQDPKKHGCPVARIEKGQIRIREQVQFAYNSAQILRASDFILEAVQKILAENPDVTAVEIQGHTDSKGGDAFNKKLSERRAASVLKWLVGHGIDRARLTSAGYGEERPIDSNDTDEGRANNRRVEFHIGAQSGASTP
jgi:outer membrane protein OmpA-like peptidoglycan-associated protein